MGVPGLLPSGVPAREVTRTLTGPGTHTRVRFTTQVATCDPGDGGRYDRSCLDDDRLAVLPGLGSILGSVAGRGAPIPELGGVPSRELRDTTRNCAGGRDEEQRGLCYDHRLVWLVTVVSRILITKAILMPLRSNGHDVADLAVDAVVSMAHKCGWACERVTADYGEDLLVQPVLDRVVDDCRIWV